MERNGKWNSKKWNNLDKTMTLSYLNEMANGTSKNLNNLILSKHKLSKI